MRRAEPNHALHGFTLLECFIVISIIAILAAMLLPVFSKAREKARTVACASNLMQIGFALHMYAQDHDSRFPPKNNDLADLMPYMANYMIFQCPSETTLPPLSDKGRLITQGYLYRGGFTNDSPGTTRLMFDARVASDAERKTRSPVEAPSPPPGEAPPAPPPKFPGSPASGGISQSPPLEAAEGANCLDPRHADGVNVLFLSGRVKWVSIAEWQRRGWSMCEEVGKR